MIDFGGNVIDVEPEVLSRWEWKTGCRQLCGVDFFISREFCKYMTDNLGEEGGIDYIEKDDGYCGVIFQFFPSDDGAFVDITRTWRWPADIEGSEGEILYKSKLIIKQFNLPHSCRFGQNTKRMIVTPLHNKEGTHMVYHHHIHNIDKGYIGITKQGLGPRFNQHLSSASRGATPVFHRALAEINDPKFTHAVVAEGLSLDEAMAIEEDLVDKFTLHPKGLNTIPGGYKGLAWYAKHGVRVPRKKWEGHEGFLKRVAYLNPKMAAVWASDEFASRHIFSRSNTFSREEFKDINFLLSLGREMEEIAAHYQTTRNRISRLARGKTYSRCH
jgi:hypothetical protein